ncbi:hypothetical protein M9458_021668, partial [Cirrhinus mrigala]
MFPSVQHRPVCNIGARAVRLQNFSTFKQSSALSSKSPAGVMAPESRKGNEQTSLREKEEGEATVYIRQPLQRALQIGELYSNLYSERSRWTLVGNIWRRLQSKHAPTGKLIAALAGVFMWEDEKIGDDELK